MPIADSLSMRNSRLAPVVCVILVFFSSVYTIFCHGFFAFDAVVFIVVAVVLARRLGKTKNKESESAIGIIAVGSVVHVLDLAHMIDLPAFGLGLIIAGAVVLFVADYL
ncbi:hypothetical protein I4I93_11065 [Corynebacterium diphtheriae bv. mitis]|nr:hypothetical protein [Corynebacterium diphtheriae bv. mitis]MBG9322781.1 hypothetical protein [Corynebacterium diphtheriae bv. mitis]